MIRSLQTLHPSLFTRINSCAPQKHRRSPLSGDDDFSRRHILALQKPYHPKASLKVGRIDSMSRFWGFGFLKISPLNTTCTSGRESRSTLAESISNQCHYFSLAKRPSAPSCRATRLMQVGLLSPGFVSVFMSRLDLSYRLAFKRLQTETVLMPFDRLKVLNKHEIRQRRCSIRCSHRIIHVLNETLISITQKKPPRIQRRGSCISIKRLLYPVNGLK